MPHQCTGCGHVFADGSKEMLSGCPDCGGNKFQFHPGGVPEGSMPDAEPPERPGSGSSVAGAVGKAATTLRDFVGGGADEPPPASADEPPTPAAGATGNDAPADAVAPERPPEAGPANAAASASASAPEDVPDDSGSGRQTDLSEVYDRREWPEAAGPTPEVDDDSGTDASTADASADAPTSAAPRPDDPSASGGETPAADGTDATVVPGDAGPQEDRAQADARSAMVDTDELPESSGRDDARVADTPDRERPGLDELREELNDQFESIKVVEPGQYELNLMELYDREEYIIALQENGRYVVEVPDSWSDDAG